MYSALVFDINEFAVHDGPGIRTSVFLKGCPLRCVWCHNPEGLSFEQEILCGTNGCTNCGSCKRVCESSEHCTLCGACVRACPKNLRRFAAKEWTSEALAVKLLKNAGFDGVTFSGGEPLAQYDFLFDVIKRIKPMHIVIETSGYAPCEVFNRMLELVDLVFLDIKILDNEKHKRFTGVSNALIVQNYETLKRSGVTYELRIPVIPGINDTMEDMIAIAALAEDDGALERVELLTYNTAAGAKYELTKRTFDYHQTEYSIDPDTLATVFSERRIPVFVP